MRIPGTLIAIGVLVLLASGPSVSAADKDIVMLQSDMVKLQNTVQALQQSVDAKNAALVSLLGTMADNVNNLTASVKKINDAVSTIRTENAAANSATTASIAAIGNDTRTALAPLAGPLGQITPMQRTLNDINQSLTGMNTQLKNLNDQVMAMKSTTSLLPTCKDLKQDADRSYLSNYFEDAITGYRDFMSQCAADSKAAEVQYQIADSLYVLKKFDQAVLDYDIFLKNYPTNDKTASALLRKGLALVELKNIPEAKKALSQITTEFKTSSEFAAAQSKLKELGTPAPPARGRGTQ